MNHQVVNQLTTMIHVPTICRVQKKQALTPYLLSNIVLSPSFSSSWWQRTARWWSRSPWPCHSSHTFWYTVFISTRLTHSFSCFCVTPNSSRSLSSQLNVIAKAVIHRRHECTDNKHGKNTLHLISVVHATAWILVKRVKTVHLPTPLCSWFEAVKGRPGRGTFGGD